MEHNRGHSRTETDGLDRPRPVASKGEHGIIVENDPQSGNHLHGLALKASTVYVLPRNFAEAASPDEFVFEQTTGTIQKLGRQAGVVVEVPGSQNYRSIHEKDAEIIAPVLVFAHSFLIEGGATLAVTLLEHLGQYIKSRWGANVARQNQALLEVVVTDGPLAKRLKYCGSIDGLSAIVPVALGLFSEPKK